MGLFGLVALLLVTSSDMLQAYAGMIKSMPPSMLQMFGGEDATSAATPEGFINLFFFSYTLLILSSYAVLAGLNITANEEERKILDVLLSWPVSRGRLVLERTLAYIVIIVGIVLLTFIGLWLGLKLSPTLVVDEGKLLAATLNMLPSTVLVLSITVLLTAFLRNKNLAATLVAVIIVASYFVDSVGRQASASFANTVRFISFYSYYDSNAVIRHGLNWGNVILLLAVTLVILAGGVWSFQHRNIGQ